MNKQLTNKKWLNLVETEYEGHRWVYASRNVDISKEPSVNAVIIAAILPDDRLVVTNEYRPAIKNFEWGLPAGLIDKGEIAEWAAIRELYEETGLHCKEIIKVSPPLASSSGLTDEICSIVWMKCDGQISDKYCQDNEQITVIPMNYDAVELLVRSNKIIGCKAYGVFLQYLSERGWKLEN